MSILYLIVVLIPIISFGLLMYGYTKSKMVETDYNGYDIANKVLASNELDELYIVLKNGFLNDEYDFNRNVIRLSKDVYNKSNLVSFTSGVFMGMIAVLNNSNKLGMVKSLSKIVELLLIVSYVGFGFGLVISYSYANIFVGILLICYLYYLAMYFVNLDVFKNVKVELKNNDILFDESFVKFYCLKDLSRIVLIVINLVKNK